VSESETILLVGGDGHGETVLVTRGVATWDGELGTYHRRTMRFMERSPVNPRSVSLRRYYAADVLVHESISDSPQEAYAWWQTLADVRLFREVGREVTGDAAEVAKFHPGG
jgi:hypothetical protein